MSVALIQIWMSLYRAFFFLLYTQLLPSPLPLHRLIMNLFYSISLFVIIMDL